MAEEKLKVDSIVTHKISLENIHEGIELMKTQQSFKILVYPAGGEG